MNFKLYFCLMSKSICPSSTEGALRQRRRHVWHMRLRGLDAPEV